MEMLEYTLEIKESIHSKTYSTYILGPKGPMILTTLRAVHSDKYITRLIEECRGDLTFHGIYSREGIDSIADSIIRRVQIHDRLRRLEKLNSLGVLCH
jgi:hypothetical protein